MKIVVFLLCFIHATALGQTLGGGSVYNFLKLPSSPLLTAAGGVNVSHNANEVSLTANNPALLQPSLSTQFNASFNAFLGGIKAYALTGVLYSEKVSTAFGSHVYYVDYGTIAMTDAAGNVSGEFRPRDYVVQVSAAKKYLERWTYGGTIKFIGSAYGTYSSGALAVDVGLLYTDSSNRLTVGLLAKNMGAQVKTYAGTAEDLPFDLEAGISKRLSKAPFGFSFTAHHLHRFRITYNDAAFNSANGFSSPSSFDKIFNHFVVATHLYIGQNLEAVIGYNHLRRGELSTPDGANGTAGFSAGLLVRFSKLQVQFARSSYQRGVGYNHIGITAQLNKLTGLGK